MNSLQCSFTVLRLEINTAVRSKNQWCDNIMPLLDRDVERCGPIFILKIDVTERYNEMFRDSLMSICDGVVND